jgi:uncharacterized protein (UPF0332 family)
MENDVELYAAKAQECLAGARSELAEQRHNNAANRAYYAAFNAAIVALTRSGLARTRWRHDEVQALFAGQLIARRKIYPARLRSVLPRIMQTRLLADYGKSSIRQQEATRAVAAAVEFVELLTDGRNA